MHRRSALRRLASFAVGAAASVALPAASRAGDVVTTTVRTASGWVDVMGQGGRVLISISPRFMLNHPAETLSLITTGRLP